MPPFKKLQLIIALLLVCNTALFAQTDKPTTPTKIPDMLQNADYVFEGTVIDAKGYWLRLDNGANEIYTSLIVQVSNVFKGNGMKLGLIQVVVKGGEILTENGKEILGEVPFFNEDIKNNTKLTKIGDVGIITGNDIISNKGYKWDKLINNLLVIEQKDAIYYCDKCWEKKYFAPWAGDYGSAKALRNAIKQFNLATDFIDRSDIVEDSLMQIQLQKEKEEELAKDIELQKIKADAEKREATFIKGKELAKAQEEAKKKANPKAKIATGGNLNLDIRNVTYSTVSTSSYIDFDIYVWGTQATYLEGTLVRLNFDKQAFGDSAYVKSYLAVTRGTPFNNYNYKIYGPGYISDTVVTLNLSTNDSLATPTRIAVGTTPLQLMHIKFKIKNCQASAKMKFVDPVTCDILTGYKLNSNDSIVGPIQSYDNVFRTDNSPITLCPIPKITGFSPAVIRAGTGEILTITGKGFGSTRGNGQVVFPNADDRDFYMLGCDSIDYLVWNDSTIKLNVPSLIIDFPNGGTAGSGKFKVINKLGYRDSTNSNLDIQYALLNMKLSVDTVKKRVNLVYNNCSNAARIFKLHSSLSAYPLVAILIDSAVNTWAKFLNIDIRLQKDDTLGYQYFTDAGSNSDTNSIIKTNNTMSALMSTIPYRSLYCPANIQRYITSADIDINMSEIWHFGMNDTKPINTNDFYQAILHEIGHSLGLDHTINPNTTSFMVEELDLMTCAQTYNVQKTLVQRSTLETGRQMSKIASLNIRDSSKVINWACSNLTKIRNFSNPKSTKVCIGNTATFDAFVEQLPGSPVPVFQWQFNTGNGVWQNISALAAAPYNLTLTFDNIYSVSFIPSLAMNNFFFRCIISNVDGCSITTQSARLSVVNSPVITQQPTNASMLTGSNQTRTFTFITTGTVTYQWYKYISKFNQPMLTNTSPYSGVTTSTLSVTATSALPIGTHQYYCIATDNTTGCTKVSNLVNLYLYAPKKLASPEAIMNDAPFGCMLSPNPASANLTIDLIHQKEEKTLVEIYNNMGGVVLQIDFTSTTKDIYIGNLPNGLYLIKLLNGSEQLSKEIIITH